MPRETHAPGPKTHVTPLQRYISTLLTCKVTLADSEAAQRIIWKLNLTITDDLLVVQRLDGMELWR